MSSKNNQKKYGFSSLSIYRVADEEIGKLKNNRIHYTYQTGHKKINDNKNKIYLNKSEQMNNISYENKNKSIEKISRNKKAIKIHNYSLIKNGENNELRMKNRQNILRLSNSSKEKEKSSNRKSSYTNKQKQKNKRNVDRIDRIIIDLVSNKDDNETVKTESNLYENDYLYKNSVNNKDNNSEINNDENMENKDNNISDYKIDYLQNALNKVAERWINDCEEKQEFNILFLCNEIDAKKKEIEKIINRWENEKKIVKETVYSIINSNKNLREKRKEINSNMRNRWKNNIKKENNKYFSILKKIDKDNFLYSEKNYIKDLTKNICFSKELDNTFFIINNVHYSNDFNKIDFKLIKTNNRNQLENDLYNFYQERKGYYIKNKDNNEELKLNPIYIVNDNQIKQLYEKLNFEHKSKKITENYLETQLSIARQTAIDYEIIEIFTPKNKNIDNNSCNSNAKRSNFSNDIKTDRISEMNHKGDQKSSEDFGQYTPLSMLNEKFFVFAVSRNIKYSIPEKQVYINLINYNKSIKENKSFDILKKNTFSSKKEKYNNLEDSKSQKNNEKKLNESIDNKNNSIIDYSKYSNNSNESSEKNLKNK